MDALVTEFDSGDAPTGLGYISKLQVSSVDLPPLLPEESAISDVAYQRFVWAWIHQYGELPECNK